MKKHLVLFLTCSLVFIITASIAQSDDQSMENKLIINELKKITRELTEIKTLIKDTIGSARGRQGPPKEATASIDDDPLLGDLNAKVTIVEFTDYQCPYCRRFFSDTFQKIKKQYIDTGKVRYVLRDLPLPMHSQAKKAAEAATCAGDQGKYWEMHDVLFKNQSRLQLKDLMEYARNLNLNLDAFSQCLTSGKYSDEVEKDLKAAVEMGISGTPSFVIGKSQKGKTVKGKLLVGAVPYGQFKAAIDSLLK